MFYLSYRKLQALPGIFGLVTRVCATIQQGASGCPGGGSPEKVGRRRQEAVGRGDNILSSSLRITQFHGKMKVWERLLK